MLTVSTHGLGYKILNVCMYIYPWPKLCTYVIVDYYGLKQNGRCYLTCRTYMQQTWFVNDKIDLPSLVPE